MTKEELKHAISDVLIDGEFDPSDINKLIFKYRVDNYKNQKQVLFKDILQCAAIACDTSVNLMNSSDRKHNIVRARFLVFMYYRQNTAYSLSKIGRMLNKDHATVIHGIKSINHDLEVKHPSTVRSYEKFNQLIINL